jgi:hypothetical protein
VYFGTLKYYVKLLDRFGMIRQLLRAHKKANLFGEWFSKSELFATQFVKWNRQQLRLKPDQYRRKVKK